jgi:EAL domain-containing protein (putative c-di-GMP-specific phosphodiesterase class I)
VKDIGDDPKEAVIANAIIQLAHSLGCRVLAEGVETKAQGDYLRSQGCDLVQGFFFGRPVSANDFGQLLQHRSTI